MDCEFNGGVNIGLFELKMTEISCLTLLEDSGKKGAQIDAQIILACSVGQGCAPTVVPCNRFWCGTGTPAILLKVLQQAAVTFGGAALRLRQRRFRGQAALLGCSQAVVQAV